MDGRWFAFGDNDKEQIEKRTEKYIYKIADEPFKCHLSGCSSSGPPSSEEYKRRIGYTNLYDIVTDDVRNCLKKINLEYGGENISVEDVNYCITQSKYEGYIYDAEGVCSGRVILRNKRIYNPVESVFENTENTEEAALIKEPFTLIECFEEYQFGLKRAGEFCVNKIKDGGVEKLANQCPVLTGVKYA